MNAVEIESAVSDLAAKEFDAREFPFEFLRAFGNKETTIQRLRSGVSNKSDVGGVLQTNNIHIAVAAAGEVPAMLARLRTSAATAKAKAQLILTTDGEWFEAEDLDNGETVACSYAEFPNYFGFFLPLAGITTVKQIRESAFDIRATSRLNRLYLELLKDNPEWGTAERRHDMNHFMARLIFCFFAEDTDIFSGNGLFTETVRTMSEKSSSNTHEVIGEIFRAMNTKHDERAAAGIARWALSFPYVNGGLFSGSVDAPRFSKIARSYLIHIGGLQWTRINPDIFGSMIQAVADDEERGALGTHYTSVPNILKVLNPLFLDDLRAKLEEAGGNTRMLLNLRKRIARIRVFDPACGSGNFLVIAYKQMREIENTVNERRGEKGRASDIPLTNFRGIEIRDFAAEIARLALIIAEFQSDVLYRGQQEALKEFLPLDSENWITCGNALRIDWLSICPSTGTDVTVASGDLFGIVPDEAEVGFDNPGGETYICGNPPYSGSKKQSQDQKQDLREVFGTRSKHWKSLDYVAGWFLKAAEYSSHAASVAAFVSTNSVCQGQQVPLLWPLVFGYRNEIAFAYTSFKWKNLANNNAGVTVVIVAIRRESSSARNLFVFDEVGGITRRTVRNINGYLVAGPNVEVRPLTSPRDERAVMQFGNHTYYGVDLLLEREEARQLASDWPDSSMFLRPFLGSREVISGIPRSCLWIDDERVNNALAIPPIASRLAKVSTAREAQAGDKSAQALALSPHRFRERFVARSHVLLVPAISSENRDYLPVGVANSHYIVGHKAYALYDAPLWNLALLASRLHWVWIATVCVRMRTDFSYSNTLGWNTFPAPALTDKNKADLTQCAENVLLARESHFPATIADLYDPDTMPTDLRDAHARNDEVLERIYIGRRFRNDTERLEKLFELYTKMTSAPDAPAKRKAKSKRA